MIFFNRKWTQDFKRRTEFYRELFQLLPTHIIAPSCVEIDEIDEIANKPVSFWGNDLETPSSLRSEMITWQMHWRETNMTANINIHA